MRSVFLVVTFFALAVGAAAQLAGSSARDIQTEVQKTDSRVEQVIERANDHFRKGKLALDENKPKLARIEFDRAVDEILLSGLDVRASERLNLVYLEIVQNIYNEEVPFIRVRPNATPMVAQAVAQSHPPPLIGFKDQKIEPVSDRLSKPIAVPPQDAIQVQGFWMGMDLIDAGVDARAPENSSDDVRLGLKKYKISRWELDRRGTKQAERSGVKEVDLTFLDDRLTSIDALYDDSVEFRNLTEFANAISRAMKLDAHWRVVPFPGSQMDIAVQKKPPYEFIAIYNRHLRSFAVTDVRTNDVIKKRRSEEKDQRRRAFKP